MRRLATLALTAAVLAGCGADPAPDGAEDAPADRETVTMTIIATADIVSEEIVPGLPPVDACTYNETAASGDQVTVLDADGTTVGVGTWALAPGADSCKWAAAVRDIPTSEDFYAFESGGEKIGTLSSKQLAAAGWKASIAIDPYGVDLAAGT